MLLLLLLIVLYLRKSRLQDFFTEFVLSAIARFKCQLMLVVVVSSLARLINATITRVHCQTVLHILESKFREYNEDSHFAYEPPGPKRHAILNLFTLWLSVTWFDRPAGVTSTNHAVPTAKGFTPLCVQKGWVNFQSLPTTPVSLSNYIVGVRK